MNMKLSKQSKLLIWCGLPFILGILTGFFKSTIVNSRVDFTSGFLTAQGVSSMTVWYIIVIACMVACAAAGFFTGADKLSFGEKNSNTPYKTILVLSGMLFMVAGAILAYQNISGSVLSLICGGFLIASGIAQIASIKTSTTASVGLCRLFPLFFAGLYLLLFYRLNARNPLIYTYVFEIITVIMLLYTLYMGAGTYFGKPKPRLLTASAILSTYMVAAVVALYALSPTFTALFGSFGLPECITAFATILLIWSEIFKGLMPDKE